MSLVRGIAAALTIGFAAFVVTAAAAPSAPAAGNAGCAVHGDWGTSRPDLASRVVDLVNATRRRHGLRPLRISPTLTRAAEWKALHMARYRYMRHEDPAPPVGRGVGARLAACGYRGGGWGENIAYGYGSAQAVVSAWLRSPGHRANILRGSFRVIGVGAGIARGGTLYWSQEFGMQDDSRRARPKAQRPARPRPATPRAQPTVQRGLSPSRLVDVGQRARVGRWFVARVAMTVTETGAAVESASVRCSAFAGRRPLRVTVSRFRDGRAVCAFAVPRGAKGKHLVGRVRAHTGDGKQAVRWFSRRIG